MCLTSGRVKPTYSACDDPVRFNTTDYVSCQLGSNCSRTAVGDRLLRFTMCTCRFFSRAPFIR
jgi:hypothetical protein